MQQKKKINLIYIASIGRSGTTLFESLLGAHSQIDTSGELHLWPHEIMNGGVLPTGSGEFVHSSPFWEEMRRRIQPLHQPAPQLHFFREKHNAGRTLRLERLREFGSEPVSKKAAEQIDQYGRNNHRVFSTFQDLVGEETGKRPAWVVDASKDAYRLLWLLRSGYFNIKVFHLVKDPRGFIFSVTKDWIQGDGQPLTTQISRLYYTLRQSVAWVIRNHLYSKIAQNHLSDKDYMLIRYEHLASDPHHVFQAACELIGCKYEAEAVSQFREGSPFAMAGNPMRQDNRPIQLDERWKHKLPTSSQMLAQAITAVNRERYGYN